MFYPSFLEHLQKTKMSDLELRVGKLIIGNDNVLEDVNIGIKEGIIIEVSEKPLGKTYGQKVDLSDKIVMPGLIDGHAHLIYSGNPEETDIQNLSDEYLAIRAAELARKALKGGVTTIADSGGRGNTTFALRNAINDGVTLGPKIRACGNMITITGGRATYGHRVIGGGIEVDGADAARKAARELLMYHGADFIKLGATGALSSPHTGARDPQLTVEEMRAATEEAHNCGRPVHAHCYGEQGISNAMEAGVDVIVHGQTLSQEHMERMKERGTILLPTLKTFCGHMEHKGEGGVHDRVVTTGIWDETEPNFRRALSKGVTLAMGTDAGMPDNLFGDNPKDLEYLVQWGMTPSQAVTAGTLNAAKTVGAEGVLGTIEKGKYADLLVLKQDPLQDISVVRTSLDRVMLNGVFLN